MLRVGIELAEPLSFSVTERLLLMALIAASLGVFAWRSWPIASNILHSK
jgi:hypothetical protein